MTRQTTIVVDDDTAFLDSTRWLLEEHDYRVEVFQDFNDALPRLKALSTIEPACLLLDIRMPTIGGVEAYDQLLSEGIDLPVIFLTGHGDIALAVEVMSKGAHSFLEKPILPDQLIEALSGAFSAAVQCRRQTPENRLMAAERAALIQSLSAREAEILNGIVEGHSAKQIADKLCITAKTVDYHRAKLMKRLDAKNIAHLQRIVALT